MRETGTCIQLVCTGRLHDHRVADFSDRILAEIHESGIADQVRLLGLIPEEDQIQLVRRSIGLLQPSLFEGWNTGIEEAMALGKPIIASDIAVHREQCGSRAAFADTGDAEAWARNLSTAWTKTVSTHGKIDRYETLKAKFATQFLELASKTRSNPAM